MVKNGGSLTFLSEMVVLAYFHNQNIILLI